MPRKHIFRCTILRCPCRGHKQGQFESTLCTKEEEGHKEEEHGEPKPPEAEEDPQDPVEDEDEPLIIADPVEMILQDKWDQCENFV